MLIHAESIWKLIVKHKYHSVVEIGVLKGEFARDLLTANDGQIQTYWMVDPWQPYESLPGTTPERWEELYQEALGLVTEFDPVAYVLRMPSLEAVQRFDDGSVDLVFLDGHHGFGHVVNDIVAWEPKVRVGGILAGHDYLEGIPPGRVEETWGVYKAVNSYFPTEEIRKEPGTIWWVQK